ncbi:MucR family transcriptional regulator [Sphingomonas sp. LY29]|uniref:MucR family transcriptional regulator n=1 Tax=Sphingomonas sp. LY29 TaxID=3095341 RepID=UPI002D7A00DE|nr:MucR family transcriptional regulator [Sphingomonas sp. LY29]WRP26414.1 MucR family transcriptional regulator [Sphingomonas sp. LY29]
MDIDEAPNNLIDLTADIVAAHVNNNSVAISDVATLISNVHSALAGLSSNKTTIEERKEPAVSIRQSVKPDYLVCLEDGKKMKMLRRYLMTNYGMTPEEYRTKWNLPKDYPMTAPSYAERRRDLAKSIGLGTKTRKTSKGNKPK